MLNQISALHRQQQTLTHYLRDPDHCLPPAEMDVARAQIYRDLVFENLVSLLSGTFPVLVMILGDTDWRLLVRLFLRDYRSPTPKFGEIAEEFVTFLSSEQPSLQEKPWPPFMVELAHYEWVEMALQQSESQPLPTRDEQWLLDQPLRVSPLAWPLAYSWPVHRLSPDFRPVEPPAQPTLLLIRRSEDWSVHFSELSPLAWRLLQRIEQCPTLAGRDQLHALASEAGVTELSDFMDSGLALLRQMHAEGIIGV